MQKLLATLAIIMSCGVVVLIAQNENVFDVSALTNTGYVPVDKTPEQLKQLEETKQESEAYIRGMYERGMTDEQIKQEILAK